MNTPHRKNSLIHGAQISRNKYNRMIMPALSVFRVDVFEAETLMLTANVYYVIGKREKLGKNVQVSKF